jgi:DNA-binding transcriptional LysR family regulator
MDVLARMATYVRVVESGTLSAAAKQLRISSAAVSRQISGLEAELKVTLLTRTTRRMVITAAGRRYYERCLRILREVDEAQSLGKQGELDGLLRINAPVTFGLACVAPHLRGLMTRHPGLLLELQLEDRLVDIAPEGFDVAIRVGRQPPESTELIAHEIVTYGRQLVASPEYLKKRGVPRRPEALAKHDGLMTFQGGADTWTVHQGEVEARIRPRVILRSNALHAIRDLATGGAGVAMLPSWFVAEALAARRLQVVLPEWRLGTVTAYAIYRREQRGAPRVRALIEHLSRALASL